MWSLACIVGQTATGSRQSKRQFAGMGNPNMDIQTDHPCRRKRPFGSCNFVHFLQILDILGLIARI